MEVIWGLRILSCELEKHEDESQWELCVFSVLLEKWKNYPSHLRRLNQFNLVDWNNFVSSPTKLKTNKIVIKTKNVVMCLNQWND